MSDGTTDVFLQKFLAENPKPLGGQRTMRGQCTVCKAKQAEGIADYCCVLCIVDKALPGLPPEAITKQADGTTVIDLSKAWGRP